MDTKDKLKAIRYMCYTILADTELKDPALRLVLKSILEVCNG